MVSLVIIRVEEILNWWGGGFRFKSVNLKKLIKVKRKVSEWNKGDVSSENPNGSSASLAGRGPLSQHLDTDTINSALLTEHQGLRELTPLAAAGPGLQQISSASSNPPTASQK